jgi:hypothetical protein
MRHMFMNRPYAQIAIPVLVLAFAGSNHLVMYWK